MRNLFRKRPKTVFMSFDYRLAKIVNNTHCKPKLARLLQNVKNKLKSHKAADHQNINCISKTT